MAGMIEVLKTAREELKDLINLEISSTVSVSRSNDGWDVILEAVEKHSIPDGMDILAAYETRLDEEGHIQEFKRIGLRKRIETGEASEG